MVVVFSRNNNEAANAYANVNPSYDLWYDEDPSLGGKPDLYTAK